MKIKLKEIPQVLKDELPKIKGILIKKTGKTILKGDNVWYDMEIENFIIALKDNTCEWFEEYKEKYELIYNS